jgi:hypothetical protein
MSDFLPAIHHLRGVRGCTSEPVEGPVTGSDGGGKIGGF